MLATRLLGILWWPVRWAQAALGRLPRPGKKFGLFLTALAAVVLLWALIMDDPRSHGGKRELSRTTYRSHDGTYSVEVVKYSDGTKEERRIEKKKE